MSNVEEKIPSIGYKFFSYASFVVIAIVGELFIDNVSMRGIYIPLTFSFVLSVVFTLNINKNYSKAVTNINQKKVTINEYIEKVDILKKINNNYYIQLNMEVSKGPESPKKNIPEFSMDLVRYEINGGLLDMFAKGNLIKLPQNIFDNIAKSII